MNSPYRLSPIKQTPDRVPAPKHRHGAPCGPWPWMDFDAHEDFGPSAAPKNCNHENCEECTKWLAYPQSHFPNWTPLQVARCGIADAIKKRDGDVIVYRVDVSTDGTFTEFQEVKVDDDREFWRSLHEEPSTPYRVRTLFVENFSGSILQMIGARYRIEPFYFSSSLGWIPSRFQDDVKKEEGDHLTVTLTFLRCTRRHDDHTRKGGSLKPPSVTPTEPHGVFDLIDAQAPLQLKSTDTMLLLDLLSIHLVRSVNGSTMISYHPSQQRRTTAKRLYARVRSAGDSVYWQYIWKRSPDATFVLLATLWHALYAWDEALEALYEHFRILETTVVREKTLELTQELYVIRAHLLYWSSLLDDLRKTVRFIRNHKNPAMASPRITDEERTITEKLLTRECGNLDDEIDRLEKARKTQEKRLKNAMDLVFATVSIDDSFRMQQLTLATVKDSASMKLISLLGMFYLPASFTASVFGMNLTTLVNGGYGTIPLYVATTLPLMLFTIYAVMAMQVKYAHRTPQEVTWFRRILWPVYYWRLILGYEGEDATRGIEAEVEARVTKVRVEDATTEKLKQVWK